MRSSKIASPGPEEHYIRARENPFFAGLLRGDNIGFMDGPPTTFDFQSSSRSRNISRSTSDIGDTRRKIFVANTPEKVMMDSPLEDLISLDIIHEPAFGRSSSERWSKVAKITTIAVPSVELPDLRFKMDDPINDSSVEDQSHLSIMVFEENERLPNVVRPKIEKSYSMNKRKPHLSGIPLPQSAASFYTGCSPQIEIVESCESIERLNLYLKSTRDDVNAGVPGRFLHAVMGQDVSDVGSIASTIMYAFFLNEMLKSHQFCTVPVINMTRADLTSHVELKWLLDSCQIEQSSLVFVDEIDLSYYDLFGSLKLVLLNGHKLPVKQEALKYAVIEIFNCKKSDSAYPWVQTVTMGQECSSCTLVAEKFALTSPNILAGQGFSRLLLAGILLDTANLTKPDCTSKDKYMATLLINGAGRFGCNGLYQILKYKMHDVSDLKVIDILRKDFKKWSRVVKGDFAGSRSAVSQIGMSSIGVSVGQLLAHQDTSAREIKHFQQLEKLRLLMIVSGYYDSEKNFKREILVSAESVELMKNLLFFLHSNASQLPLRVLRRPGLQEEMKAFEVDKVTSRTTIERLLEEFGGASAGHQKAMQVLKQDNLF